MEIKVLLNDIEVEIENMPTITFTKDETNDSATLVLKVNEQQTPYKPDSVVKIQLKEDDKLTFNTIQVFYLAYDEVKVFSYSPKVLYKHTLHLTQSIRALAKHIVRNTVFTQSRGNVAYYAIGNVADVEITNTNPGSTVSKSGLYVKNFGYQNMYQLGNDLIQEWKEKIHLVRNDIVGFLKISFDLFAVRPTIFNVSNKLFDPDSGVLYDWTNFYDFVNNNSLYVDFNIVCEKSDGTSITLPISIDCRKYITNVKNQLDISNYTVNDSQGGKLIDRILSFKGDDAIDLSIEIAKKLFAKPLEIDPADLTPYEDVFKTKPPAVFLNVFLEINDRRNTLYYILDTLIKQTRRERQRSVSVSNDICYLPTSGEFYDLLVNTSAPTVMSFTQSTLFDAIKEVYRFFDAIPTINENKVLGIEFLNKRGDGIVDKYTGVSLNHKEDNYNNSYFSNYQNAIIKKEFPSGGAYTRVRTPVLGVPTQEDFIFMTDGNINYLNKANILVKYITTYYTEAVYKEEGGYERHAQPIRLNQYYSVDVSHFILEQSLWSTLGILPNIEPYDRNNMSRLLQTNTLRYTKGSNQINLSNYYTGFNGNQYTIFGHALYCALCRMLGFIYYPTTFSPTADNIVPQGGEWQDILMRVEYEENANGLLKVDSPSVRYDGETLISQSNGQVDLTKLGINMYGTILKNGEVGFIANQTISKWEDRIKKGDVYIDKDGNQYIANVVSYTFINDVIQTSVEFSKNFNALSQRVKVDTTKRLSNISNDLATLCEDVISEYFYLSSTSDSTRVGEYNDYINNMNTMVSHTFGASQDVEMGVDFAKIAYAYIGENDSVVASDIYIPMKKYASGNSICFEMQFNDAINAGNALLFGSDFATMAEGNWFSQAVKYTDDSGVADTFDISLCMNSVNQDIAIFDYGFPKLNYTGRTLISLLKYKYYKKPNEIFGLNYQFTFLPLPNRENIDFIGRKFLEENGLLTKTSNIQNIYIYYSETETYDITDTHGKGERILVDQVDTDLVSRFIFHLANAYDYALLLNHANSFAICNELGEIYFASNNKPSMERVEVSPPTTPGQLPTYDYRLNIYTWHTTVRYDT